MSFRFGISWHFGSDLIHSVASQWSRQVIPLQMWAEDSAMSCGPDVKRHSLPLQVSDDRLQTKVRNFIM